MVTPTAMASPRAATTATPMAIYSHGLGPGASGEPGTETGLSGLGSGEDDISGAEEGPCGCEDGSSAEEEEGSSAGWELALEDTEGTDGATMPVEGLEGVAAGREEDAEELEALEEEELLSNALPV